MEEIFYSWQFWLGYMTFGLVFVSPICFDREVIGGFEPLFKDFSHFRLFIFFLVCVLAIIYMVLATLFPLIMIGICIFYDKKLEYMGLAVELLGTIRDMLNVRAVEK